MANLTPRGYRSATEYRFGEEHTDAIVRTAAYHREDFPLSVIWFSPRKHVNIRPSIATPFQRASTAGLGSLDRLPLELLHDTLFRLDMHSLFKFRQINLGSRQTVDSLKQYQMVVSHGLNLLYALLRTRLATGISLLDFYNALCTKACSLCRDFGGFIFLPTWTRCCFKCLREAPETQMLPINGIRKIYHREFDQLISFRTLPGKYSLNESGRKSRIDLASAYQAHLICGRKPLALAQARRAKPEYTRVFNSMASCALPYYDKVTGDIEYGISCAGCQLALETDIIGSRGERWAFEVRDKVYARDGFLEHFKWCEQAQLLWTSSCEGNNRPTELPEVARRGGFFSKRE